MGALRRDGEAPSVDLHRGDRLGLQVEVPARMRHATIVRRGEDHRLPVAEELQDDRPLTSRAPTGRREQEDVLLPVCGDPTLGATVDPDAERREPPVERALDDDPEALLARQAPRGLPGRGTDLARRRHRTTPR